MGQKHFKDVLSTGEAARICNVAPRTVSKWFDSGQLLGYVIPGSKDRRIPLNQLAKFMKKHGIPLTDIYRGTRIRVLIVSHDTDIADVMVKSLSSFSAYEFSVAGDTFRAGVLIEKLKPHVIFVDTAMPHLDMLGLMHHIASDEQLQLTKAVAIDKHLPPDLEHRLLDLGFAACIKNRCHAADILALIEALTVGKTY